MEHEKTKEDGGMNECGVVVVVSDTEKRDGEVRTTSFIRVAQFVCFLIFIFFTKKKTKSALQ